MSLQDRINLWKAQAEHDLFAAEENLKIKLFDICLIQCEQAVEKILKALFIKVKKTEPPKTHNLEILLDEFEAIKELKEFITQIDMYYFTLRYPSMADDVPYSLVSEADAVKGLDNARLVFARIKEEFNL